MKTTYFALLLLAIAAFTGCSQQPRSPEVRAITTPDLAKEEAAIRAADAQWLASARSRDAAKTASFWSDDASLVLEGMPTITGHANLQKFVEGAFADKGFSIDWTVDKIEVARSGELAYETAFETVTSTQGKKVVASKTFETLIWKKQPDGNWKTILQQSSEVPAATPAKK
jgi:uncharacterized protein (TIGR02246 family)